MKTQGSVFSLVKVMLGILLLVGCAHNVLVVGGMDNNGNFLNTAEIYDPTSGTFVSVNPMSTGRMSASVTTLADNTVLVAGGEGATAAKTAEYFQPSNSTFSLTSGMLNNNRIAHTATWLDNAVVSGQLANAVLITGGDAFSRTGTAEIYNPAAKIFTNTSNMLTPRTQHTAVLISNCHCQADGKVLVVGGYDNGFNVLPTAELYDTITQTFTATGVMHTPRFRHTATLLANGTVLITGGASQMQAKPGDINPALNTAEIYDPKTGKFTLSKGNMTAYREAHGASLLQDGTVLLTGGQDQHFLIENTAELYNPNTGTFNALSNSCAGSPPPAGCMMVGRDFHITETLDDGRVLIAGGVNSNFQTVASAEIYSPSTKTFSLTGSMSTPRNGAGASLISSGIGTRIQTNRQIKKHH